MANLAQEIDYSDLQNKSKLGIVKHNLDKLNMNYSKHKNLFTVEDNYYIYNDISEKTSVAAYYATSGDKYMTNHILSMENINVPNLASFNKDQLELAIKWFENINKNVVLKPLKGDLGECVYLNISTKKELKDAWEKTTQLYDKIVLEEMIKGDDYRLLVIGGKYCAATKREPFYIIGNGIKSIKDLIEEKNQKRLDHPYISVRRIVEIDDEILQNLKKQRLKIDSILKKDKKIYLKNLPNIAKGGEHTDISSDVHESFRKIVEQAFLKFPPTGYLGFDLIAKDITKPADKQTWSIIEVDSHACLMHHIFPVNGSSRDTISLMILDNLKNHKTKNDLLKISNHSKIIENEKGLFTTGYEVHKQLLKKAAWERNLSVDVIKNRLWSIKNKTKKHYFLDNMPDTTSQIARWITNGKNSTKSILEKNAFNIPKGKIFNKKNINESWEFALEIGLPIVIKPTSGTGGKGVYTDIKDFTSFKKILKDIDFNNFILEKHIVGNDYRVLIINGQFVAASKRVPANIIGDGKRTLKKLIEEKNKLRALNPHLGKSPITISKTINDTLKKDGITLESVINKNQLIYLQQVANVGSGGDSFDVTDDVHVEFKKILCEAYKIFPSMHYCGFDIQVKDISISPFSQDWAIIEVNANADIGFHHFPWKGKGRDVAGALIDSLFPNEKDKLNLIQKKCVKLIISGKVQNVGYRNWLQKQAFLHGIFGWNQNIDNDKVEAFLIGMPNAIEHLIKICYLGTARAIVKDIKVDYLNTDITKNFEIIK